MIKDLLQSISKVYIAYGATDFRKQIDSLCIEVKSKFHLNPYEKALGIRNLMDKYGLTQEETAKRIGKSRSAISQDIR